MNVRKSLLMALLLGAGGFYVWRYDHELVLPGGGHVSDKTEKFLLPDLKLSEITRIGVIRADGSWNILRVSAAPPPQDPFGTPVQWELKKPKGAPVEPQKIETLARSLASLSIRNTLEKHEIVADESVYGLTPPAVVLQLEGKFGKRIVSLGEKHPISGRRYVQIDGDERLYLTEDSIYSLLDVPAESFRQAQVLAFDPKTVKKIIAIRDQGDTLALESNEHGGWKLTSGAGTIEADAAQIQTALTQLSRAKVKRFIDDTPETLAFFGLTRPKLLVSLVFEEPKESESATVSTTEAAPSPTATTDTATTDDEPDYFPRNKSNGRVVIQIGEGINTDALLPPTPTEGDAAPAVRSKASYFGKLGGVHTIFEFGRSYFSDFLQPADHFRTKAPFRSLKPDSLGQIRLKFGGEQKAEVTLARSSESGWAVSLPDGSSRPVSVEELARFLDAVRRLRVVTYTTLPDKLESTGLQDPELEIELLQRNPESRYTVRIGGALPSAATDAAAGPVEGGEAAEPPRYGSIGGLPSAKAIRSDIELEAATAPIVPATVDTTLGAVLSASTAARITAEARQIGGVQMHAESKMPVSR